VFYFIYTQESFGGRFKLALSCTGCVPLEALAPCRAEKSRMPRYVHSGGTNFQILVPGAGGRNFADPEQVWSLAISLRRWPVRMHRATMLPNG
jgi:hypothetical protein